MLSVHQQHPSCLLQPLNSGMSARVLTRILIVQRMRNALTLLADGMLVTLNTMALPVQSKCDSCAHFGAKDVRLVLLLLCVMHRRRRSTCRL